MKKVIFLIISIIIMVLVSCVDKDREILNKKDANWQNIKDNPTRSNLDQKLYIELQKKYKEDSIESINQKNRNKELRKKIERDMNNQIRYLYIISGKDFVLFSKVKGLIDFDNYNGDLTFYTPDGNRLILKTPQYLITEKPKQNK